MNAPTPPTRLARTLSALIDARRCWQLLLAVLVAMVCFLAFAPHPPDEASLGWDKLNHAVAFAVLALVGRFGFPATRGQALGVALGLLAFGVLIELVQGLVPGRSSEWADLAADSLGIVAGMGLAQPWLRMARLRRA